MEALKLPVKKPTLRLIGKCGCGKPATHLVYEHEQEHCTECMLEAVDCSVSILVRQL